ncbi:MAG: hypothetical protein JXX29_00675 [Deltaproteobacteria bacterium]|nr:hypothetical protein [Deltaproteobacteria bacterium]MBN2670151.1 hypothetical protein [Deltaproteobacteria bacterium]
MSVAIVIACGQEVKAKRNPMLTQEEIEYVPPPFMEMAQQALVEGDLEAAVRVLKAAQSCWAARQEKCGFTQTDYQSLSGVVYLEHGLAKKAVRSLNRVVTEQPNRTMAWFYLGQAHLQLFQYRQAAEALTEAASVGANIPEYYGMLVRAWKGANEDEKARLAIATGLGCFPNDAALLYEGTLLYLSKGLFFAALDLARQYAAATTQPADAAYLLVAESYRKKGWMREAIATLEEARLVCGQSSQATVRLAYAYAENNQPTSAARLFEQLAGNDFHFAQVASEQYRLAGHIPEAQRLAIRIPDPTKRQTQLAIIALQVNGFETVVQLLEPIFIEGKLGDQGTFRLAYAALRCGRLDLVERLLRRLKNTQNDESVTQLKKALSRCTTQPWECW